MYQVRILEAGSRDLARLDKPIGHRIVERIDWLATNLENLKPEPLTGDLIGFYKLRVGDYRVIYEIIPNEQIILIHAIRNRPPTRDLSQAVRSFQRDQPIHNSFQRSSAGLPQRRSAAANSVAEGR